LFNGVGAGAGARGRGRGRGPGAGGRGPGPGPGSGAGGRGSGARGWAGGRGPRAGGRGPGAGGRGLGAGGRGRFAGAGWPGSFLRRLPRICNWVSGVWVTGETGWGPTKTTSWSRASRRSSSFSAVWKARGVELMRCWSRVKVWSPCGRHRRRRRGSAAGSEELIP